MPVKYPEMNHQGSNMAINNTHLSSENYEVVISGISGRFPESNSIAEFKDNLYAGVDLVTDDDRRWPSGKKTIQQLILYMRNFFLNIIVNTNTCIFFKLLNSRSLWPPNKNRKIKRIGIFRCQFFWSTCETG